MQKSFQNEVMKKQFFVYLKEVKGFSAHEIFFLKKENSRVKGNKI